MTDWTIEGIVENGQIRLLENISLPERTKVFVIVPGAPSPPQSARIISPRLANPEQADQFRMQVFRGAADLVGRESRSDGLMVAVGFSTHG